MLPYYTAYQRKCVFRQREIIESMKIYGSSLVLQSVTIGEQEMN